MQSVVFFDIEVSEHSGNIQSIGACLGEQSWRGRSLHDFTAFCRKARFFCGHNIFAHDLPHLSKAGIEETFLKFDFIDTLYLSALFFASKPYHHLVKDYQLAAEHLNDPVEDARLAQVLLQDCLTVYAQWPQLRKTLFASLLVHTPEFKAFFLLTGQESFAESPATTVETILAAYDGWICRHAPLRELIADQPIPLAYALALVDASDQHSVIPPWLLHQYPGITTILHQLRATSCRSQSCSYCQQYLSATAGLQRYFGFPGFRKFSDAEAVPLQEQVVEAALKGESLLAIFPTGGGKSLSFQLPALMQAEAGRGLTVVISPLQALMKDQVDVLRVRFNNIQAVAIYGLLSPLERAEAIHSVEEGGASILYIAPESLRSATILRLLRQRHIERFVIDEAHCFSAWGQDFRTDYLYIGRFLQELATAKGLAKPIPVSCFTATAKPEVVADIRRYFAQTAHVQLQVYQTSVSRENLHYFASKAAGEQSKQEQLCALLQQAKGPAIVYVNRTRTAEQLSTLLKKAGFQAAHFHGQMETHQKIAVQDKFSSGETQVMIATSAFGMGVDKADVEMVVHYDMASSLENYMQEAGRAARQPELQARCHLLYDEDDLQQHFNLLLQSKLTRKEISQIWRALQSYKENKFTSSALEIARQAGWDTEVKELETKVKAALAALEEAGLVRRTQNAPRIFAKSIRVRHVEEARRIIAAHPHLFTDKMQQEAIRIFKHIICRKETHADYMADALGLAKEQVEQILLLFGQLGLLGQGDALDLSLVIHPERSGFNTALCFSEHARMEEALLALLLPSEETSRIRKCCYRDINEKLSEQGLASSEHAIRKVLQYWEAQRFLRKERLDAVTGLYRLEFRMGRRDLQKRIAERLALTAGVVRWLLGQVGQQTEQQSPAEHSLEFSTLALKEAVDSAEAPEAPAELLDYHSALVYLNAIEAIKLEKGLFVMYNPMRLETLAQKKDVQYSEQDYALLEAHYQKKTEQIHIMAAYARRQLSHHLQAMEFVNDYFTLGYEAFLQKYFSADKGRLRQPISEKQFQQIFSQLSEEQLQVVKDGKSRNILIGAGPGSGKTKVLVHKVASLLLVEDIKPEQFLMLTFSRPAAREFKTRLQALVGSLAYRVDIFTYHGFAFRLQARVGDLQKSAHILSQTTQDLTNGRLISERVQSKSVIVVDEYQDISEQEYAFLQALMVQAGEVRVIVAGDDDQNIYEFRGSSLAFMRSFARQRQAQTYMLTRNYRACANLVDFSNEFLSLFRSERLKAKQLLLAHSQRQGSLKITRYAQGNHMVMPLARQVARDVAVGGKQWHKTVAVLTATNEEALWVASELQRLQIPATPVGREEGFALRNLLELQCFSHYLSARLQQAGGKLYISPQIWQDCREKLRTQWAASANLPLALQLIDQFDRQTAKTKSWADWLCWLHQTGSEEFTYPTRQQVWVSTMHKAKGKEFDAVYLLLSGFQLSGEEKKRVVYVAITRAIESLSIHTDQPYFNDFVVAGLQHCFERERYPVQESFALELGLKDVWLSYCRQPGVVAAIKQLWAGEELCFSEHLYAGLRMRQGATVVKFAQTFQERLSLFHEQGYRCEKAEAAYIIIWYCEEDSKEYRVVLPRLCFVKQKN